MRTVISSLSLRRLKLLHKLNMEDPVIVDENPRCNADLGDKDEDLNLIVASKHQN